MSQRSHWTPVWALQNAGMLDPSNFNTHATLRALGLGAGLFRVIWTLSYTHYDALPAALKLLRTRPALPGGKAVP